MCQHNQDGAARSKYLGKLGISPNRAVQLMNEIGMLNGKNVVAFAVKRCKQERMMLLQRSDNYFDTWSSHTSSTQSVLQEVEKIIKELYLPTNSEKDLRKEIESVYRIHNVFESSVIDATNYGGRTNQ